MHKHAHPNPDQSCKGQLFLVHNSWELHRMDSMLSIFLTHLSIQKNYHLKNYKYHFATPN